MKKRNSREPLGRFRVMWLNFSDGKAPSKEFREFHSGLDATKFAHKLASYSGKTKISVQTKLGRTWRSLLRFTSPRRSQERDR